MMIPTIHLNGTSRDALLTQVLDAAHAVTAAINAVAAAVPNGRDYYPQGPTALSLAMQEHGNRLWLLVNVLDQLQAIAEAIANEGG